ncbi:MAG: nucleotidyl transferase AbiEii/AbiGii toxin family protein [Candidatus Thermoplasmatota archaeon]|nr:nucleotidyl transferase AbiEii/AbiGii toxin family protein [Candidatus Thermoplasmatota archaeon]
MKTRLSSAFEDQLITTSKSALVELMRTLRHYKEAIVLVGGWVPYLLLESHKVPEDTFRHVGSIDIDLIVDPNRVSNDEYQTMVELIAETGWEQVPGKQFTFERKIRGKDTVDRDITVDFLTPQQKNEEGKHRYRGVQSDLMARTMVGAELGLSHNYWYHMKGEMPNGAVTEIDFKMLDVVGCIGTKSIALGDRYKHKDAYDIVSVLDHYGNGVKEVANAFMPFLEEQQIQESLKRIGKMFSNERSEGALLYAEFLEPLNKEEKEIFAQRGYMLVSEFLSDL